jgi:nicotinate dehydrogenase subunit A
VIKLTVNGKEHEVDVDLDTPLLYVLREELALNGAKFGCGLGQCGSCTVLLDDKPVFSCLVPVAALGNRKVRTLEGLPKTLPAAFEAEQAAQCGYCIAGMIVRAQALLERNPRPTEQELLAHLAPNLCRCGTHVRILRAIRRAAEAMGGGVRDMAEKT